MKRKASAPQEGHNVPNLLLKRETGNLSSSSQMEQYMLRKQIENLKIGSESSFVDHRRRRPTPAPVYGIEFCKNQKIALTAHGDGMVYGHDVITHQKVLQTPDSGGHRDSANGCTSIDSNYFASYSDDNRVLIWDLRNMTSMVKECLGHVKWVKNVSVLKDGKTLVSTGCDQTIRKFDLNCPEPQLHSRPLLFLDGLCRTQLHPTDDALCLTTWRASVLAINNLNLDYLEQDALNYYLTSNGEIKSTVPVPPFSRTRNRLDVVHYVPYNGSSLTSGQSLALHPNGGCCAVRYNREDPDPKRRFYPIVSYTEWVAMYSLNGPADTPGHHEPEEVNVNSRRIRKWRAKVKLDTISSKAQWTIWSRMRLNEKIEGDLLRSSDITKTRLSLLYSQWIDDSNDSTNVQPQMVRNASHYAECDAFHPGIIKEISFSPCGKLILDPTQNGFRVLGYNDALDDYSHKTSQNEKPKPLQQISEIKLDGLVNNCVCARFSINGWSILCGTLEGKVIWCETAMS